MIDLRRVQYFVAVAEELHFTRAAERLRIAQPALSQQVKKLEDELGVQLLRRTRGRPVELTEAGKMLHEEGTRLLRHASRTAEMANLAANGRLGRLRVGFIPSAANVILPLTMRAFRGRLPDVSVELQQLLMHEQLEGLNSGSLDIAFVRPPFAVEHLEVRTLVEEPLVVVLPEGHRLGRRKRLPVSALAEEPFVMEPRWVAPPWFDSILALCMHNGFSPNIVQEVVMTQTQLGLIAAGLGVALLPASVGELRRAGLCVVPVEAPPIHTALAWRRESRSGPLDVFVDAALGAAAEADLLPRRVGSTRRSESSAPTRNG